MKEIKTNGTSAEYVKALILVAKAGNLKTECRILDIPIEYWPEIIEAFGGELWLFSPEFELQLNITYGISLTHRFGPIDFAVQKSHLPVVHLFQAGQKPWVKDGKFLVP